MSSRARIIVFALVCLLAAGGAAAYVVSARLGRENAAAATAATATAETLTDGPHLVFRNTAPGPDYGSAAMVALDDTLGPRADLPTDCDRLDVAAGRVACLWSERGLVTTHRIRVLDETFSAVLDLPLAGLPSRTRLSDDGTLVAATSFVTGDSYVSSGFSTRTVIAAVDGGDPVDLESFTLVHDGDVVRPLDRNYWGVTFAQDADTFYATASWSGQTWLVRGSLDDRELTTIRSDAECPSLSPDGTRLAYKKRDGSSPGQWRLAVLDLANGRETALAEERSVDDQVEWLDDETLVYGLPRDGAGAATSDVYAIPADGSGSPRLLVEHAWSPSVAR